MRLLAAVSARLCGRSGEGDSIRLNPELSIWIDSEEFTQAYTQGVNGEPDALAHLETCIELYRGEFMAGYYDDWALFERERLRNLYLAALEHLAAGYKSQGQYEQALAHARALVSQDPWSEEAQREVMRLYHLLGRSASALRQYETCQRLLEDELGVEPDPETRALAAEIAERAGLEVTSWLPVSARPGLAPLLERPDRLPLVGRQTELAELLRLAEAAARGQGGMALVYGEAGVGKTRLLGELARNAQWRGLHVAWGRCYELAGPPAYQPLVEVFRSDLPALSESTLEPLWHSELARLLPELATGEAPPELKPEEEQRRLMEAVARGFLALSKAAPHLILLEDAHWMDQASLTALRYLLPRLAEASLLIVVSTRSEELSPQHAEALAALQNTRLPRRLDLGRLDQAETGQLVQHSLDLDQPPTLFSARLYDETEGNPFFLTETLRALVDEGMLYRNEQGTWSTPWDNVTNDYATLPLPGSVVQSIQGRLERLPAPLADALGLAAVIGRSISFELWQQASNIPEAELLTAGDELCARGLLFHAENTALSTDMADADYIFAHDQIRHVAYENLAAPRRRSHHKKVAQALTILAPDKPEALAYHWSAAQVWDKAAAYHQQAGEQAMQVYALADALNHFTQALEGLERLPGAPDLLRQYELRLGREKIYDLQGARQAQTVELAALAGLADALGDDHRRAEVALRQARQADLTSDFPNTIAAASRAVKLARATQDAPIEIEGHMEWGWALLMQGEHSPAQMQFDEALALARRADLRRLEADGLHGLGTVYLVTGEYAEGRKFFQQVLKIADQVDIRPRQATALANLGYIATAQGDHTASKQYSQQALQIHRQTGDQRGAALVMQNLADVYLEEGEFAAARSYLEQALVIQQTTQAKENVGGILGALGLLYHKLGDYTRAKQYYTQGMEIFDELGIRWYQGQNLAFQSLLYHHLGDNQTARQLSQQGLEIAREIGDRLAEGWLLNSLGHALASLGAFEQAAEAYQQALSIRQEQGDRQKAADSLAGLARLGLKQGNLASASQHVEEILRIESQAGLAGTTEPLRVYLTCYRVLEACQDERAGELLKRTYAELEARKASIQDEALERSFMENVAANRELIAAYHARQSQEVQVSLPRAGTPGGRPLRPDEYIEVTWTVSAPEDERIADKTERRQKRLQRLLQQAREQGATPTYDQLAQALETSLRTIKRDMATLRQQRGAIPPKRKKMAP
jgi:tetratricopeptide (TPR) repeat protein